MVLAAAVACTVAAPPEALKPEYVQYRTVDSEAPIVRSGYESSPEGNFKYGYQTGNGIDSYAVGVIKNAETVSTSIIFDYIYRTILWIFFYVQGSKQEDGFSEEKRQPLVIDTTDVNGALLSV